jgi:hypothetical protein
MIGYLTLKNLFNNILATGLVNEVYHSVVIATVDGRKKPQAPLGGRYTYVGVVDTKGFGCYCRVSGALEVVKEDREGSCSQKLLTTQIPHRLVFYNDHETREQDSLLGQLIKAVIGTKDIKLQRALTIADTILKEESEGKYNFKPSAFYAAIDFLVVLKIQTDNCQADFGCEGLDNPYR